MILWSVEKMYFLTKPISWCAPWAWAAPCSCVVTRCSAGFSVLIVPLLLFLSLSAVRLGDRHAVVELLLLQVLEIPLKITVALRRQLAAHLVMAPAAQFRADEVPLADFVALEPDGNH